MMLSKNCLPWLLALLLTTIPLAPASAQLVGKGEVREAGREAAEQVIKDDGLYANSAAQRRVRTIGTRLARLAKYQEGTVYAFRITNSEEVNAFALPDGHIFITRGLYEELSEEDDLIAAVLGHELGHISELHSHRRVERALRQEIGYSIFGAILGKKIGKTGQIAASVLNQYFHAEYSQDQEVKADHYGILLPSRAGYDPTAMMAVLDLFAQREKSLGPLDYLKSHPQSSDRIKLANEFFDKYETGQVTVADYTTPKPPAEAFAHTY